MSSKSSKGPKQGAKIALPPRAIEDIQKEYAQLCAKVGQTAYQIFVLQRDLDEANEQLLTLNQEGAARQKLDAEAKAKEEA